MGHRSFVTFIPYLPPLSLSALLLTSFFLITLLQQYWSPCCSLTISGTLPPQGLSTCCFLLTSTGVISPLLQGWLTCCLLTDTLFGHPI